MIFSNPRPKSHVPRPLEGEPGASRPIGAFVNCQVLTSV
jgi:hypothetical protein